MPDYRRWRVEGATYFLTIVTFGRRPLFAHSNNVDLLRSSLLRIQQERPFVIEAAVVLPDHIHFLWTLPPGDADFSARIGRLKVGFTRALSNPGKAPLSASRHRHRETSIWQRRFWEHLIRDGADFKRHLDYVQYNPVKHDYCLCPHQWRYSSFEKWVSRGEYDSNWGCACVGTDGSFHPPNADSTMGE